MVDVVEDVLLRVKGRNYRFEKVKHELCKNCGERIFDLETSRMFDEKVLSRRKSRAA
jgi:YgiT-type zinc finger domain-containing protein